MENIPALLSGLQQDGKEVWAPQVFDERQGTVLFGPWKDDSQITLDKISAVSPKSVLMPATEKLFSFQYRSGESCNVEIEAAPVDEPETILFGALACDARAFAALDTLFMGEAGNAYRDPLYAGRRDAITVVTVGCVDADPACFCSSFATGDEIKEGSDLFLYPVEDGYLAEPLSEKGQSVLDNEYFEDSMLAPPPLAETAAIALAGIDARLKNVFDDMEFWAAVSEKCLSCGLCTYSCPACHCFNIFDEMRSDLNGERLRGWDACMFHLYSQEASGHNPRPTIAHRYRNRINHKFSFFPANHGRMLCTGCGRCIRGCPVNMDIREVLMAAGATAELASPDTETMSCTVGDDDQ
jgi:ferredoxin